MQTESLKEEIQMKSLVFGLVFGLMVFCGTEVVKAQHCGNNVAVATFGNPFIASGFPTVSSFNAVSATPIGFNPLGFNTVAVNPFGLSPTVAFVNTAPNIAVAGFGGFNNTVFVNANRGFNNNRVFVNGRGVNNPTVIVNGNGFNNPDVFVNANGRGRVNVNSGRVRVRVR